MPRIYDNIDNHLSKGLNSTLSVSTRADLCVGYFNLRGWKEIGNNIEKLSGGDVEEGAEKVHRCARLLVGMQKMPIDVLKESFNHDDNHIDQAEVVKLRRKLALEFKEQLTIGTPTIHDEKALRLLSRQMKDKKVVVKLHLRYPLHAKLYLCFLKDRGKIEGYVGSSNLTLAGLSKQGELNVDVEEQDAGKKLVKWFEDRWMDRWCFDITDDLIDIIDNSWAADKLYSPYHIYLKIAYHLAREARAGINEFKLPKIFQKELLDFQQKAVLVAAHHLHKRNGVMIGDVVGLGKTITATALAKLFNDDFFLETLIICPKNLIEMWEDYAHKYQLSACKVISQSKVQKILPTLRRYRLIIIDESHNLRNDQGSRYRAIKSYLEENESKVILLSATPYNKSYLDLSNQLRLFIPDDLDLGISPERYLESIGGRIQFEVKHSSFIRSIKAFEHSEYADDWRELMRLYLVRRTRSFIKANYAKEDEVNGRKYLTFSDGSRSYFPERIAKKVEYEFDPNNPKDQYAKLYSNDVVAIINQLNVPRYGLGNYVEEKPIIKATKEELIIIDNLSRAGKRLMGFCRTNLFKRLESSGFSFLLSLSRHIIRNYIFIYAIENRLPLPIGKNVSHNLDEFLEDEDLENIDNEKFLTLILNEETYIKQAQKVYALFSTDKLKKKFEWIRSELFTKKLQTKLIEDSRAIIEILNLGKDWNPSDDRQLNALYELITKKHKSEKVLVFTQFADTAYYLFEQLKLRGLEKLDFVTGDSESPTALAHKFSPNSNKKSVKPDEELRVLITTDVLSEGQNLQDSHIILNYDLPWAIIRLIQRAGRVDRIGQKAEQIFCYSFLPEDGIERIINLRRTLTNRIKENAEVVGSDETFFDGDPVNVNDLYNESSGILEEKDDDAEVDLASYAYQIWKNATDADPSLNKLIPDLPNVVYATKVNNEEPEKEGVVVYSRTVEDNDVLAWLDKRGKVITNSQLAILKATQCNALTKPLYKLENHHELVANAVDHIREEEKNSGGTLGKKAGVKYRVYMRLDRYIKEFENTIFVTEGLKKSIDDIYKYPLKEFAKDTLSRQMKAGMDDNELASLVVSLREDEKLCHINIDEQPTKEPQIICSMGLANHGTTV